MVYGYLWVPAGPGLDDRSPNWDAGEADMPPPDAGLPEFRVDGSSPTFDLALVSFTDKILGAAKLALEDDDSREKFEQLIDTLVDGVDQSIADYEAGFLLRINLFKTNEGNPAIAGGELITPIGLGREPVDALARYYHEGDHEESSAGLQDDSFFFWVVEQDESRNLYEMSEAMQADLSNAGWDSVKIERAVRQIGSCLQTSDASIVAGLVTEGVEFFVGGQSEVVSGAEASSRLQHALNFSEAIDWIYSESQMIVRADVIGLGAGLLWLALADDATSPGQTAMQLVTVNPR
jgi:hypothetical protein